MTYELVPLGEIATIERQGINPSQLRSSARYVGLEHIDGSGVVEGISVENGDLASTKFAFTREHLLYGKLRPYLRKIARPDFDGICSTDIIPIKPGSDVDRGYLFHFLRLDETVDKANSLSAGANLPRISPRILETFEVPLPPISEQQRIAAILDQADDLRRKRREALEKAKALIGAFFIERFGDPLNHSSQWPFHEMGAVSSFENGDRSSNYPSGDDIRDAGIPFLSTRNIVDDRLDLSSLNYISPQKFASLSRGKARANDVIITLRGTLGSCCIFRGVPTAFINAQMMIIRAGSKILPNFLHTFLTLPMLKAYLLQIGNGAAVPQLTATQLSDLPVPVPPLDLQRAFAASVAEIDALNAHHRAHLEKLDALFASLQHRAFRGEL